MTAEKVRETATGFLSPSAHAMFAAIMSDATGIRCWGAQVSVGRDANQNPDPTKDRIAIVFESSPDDVDVDNALAAWGSTPMPVSGTLAVTSGEDELLADPIIVEAGESVALEISVHVGLGTADDFIPTQFQYMATVYRRTAGSVLATDPTGIRDGRVPGLAINIVCDATRAWVYATQRVDGTLTIIGGEVIIRSRGMVPA